MTIQCTWEERGFFVRYQEPIRPSETVESRYCFYRDDRSDEAKYQIIDLSQVRSGELLDEDFDMACAMDIGGSTYLPDILVAFVVSNADVLNQALNYMERARAGGCNWSFRVYTSLEEARTWIRLETGWQ